MLWGLGHLDGFSAETKSELIQVRSERACCRKAELAGLVHSIGSIRLSRLDGLALVMQTENPAVARKVMTLTREIFGVAVEVIMEDRPRLGRRHSYRIEVAPGEESRRILSELQIMDRRNHLDGGVAPGITRNDCDRWAFLRGAFIGAGSISDPAKSTYHLEFVSENPDFAQGLFYLLSLGHLKAKLANRKSTHIVYLKESDSIVRLLSLLGACNAVLKIEDLRVLKEMRGGVNRLVNAETANLAKAADSGAVQVKMIRDLEQKVGLWNLPDPIREFAAARLENPEISLRELGALMRPPLGKSAVNHRLIRLRELWHRYHLEGQ